MITMQTAPRPPGLVLNTPLNIIDTFVKLREVVEDIACVNLGRKSLDYRAFIQVNPINFALLSDEEQEEIIEGFKGFLNGISFPIQILIRNLPHNLERYLNAMEAVEGDLAEIAHDHVEFVRTLASRRALVKREFYIIVPADRPTARNAQEALHSARAQLSLRIEEMLRQLERVGLNGKRLRNIEIVRLYQSCFMSWEGWQLPITERLLAGANGLMTSALKSSAQRRRNESLAPLPEEGEEERASSGARPGKIPGFFRVPELIVPSAIEISPSYLRIDGEANHEYARTLALVGYPRSAYPGWFESIIQVDEPNVDFSIHVQPLSPQEVNARLSRKAVEFRGAMIFSQRQGRTANPTTTVALEDVETLRENLVRGNERVFNISSFILVRGRDRRELSERTNRLVSTIRSQDFRALPTHWQHHMGLLSCLPDLNNQLARGRLFGTNSAATFYPFTGSNISMETGVMFGVDPNGGLIILDPFNSEVLENANMVVFAKSGAGKSFFLKTVACRLLPTSNVFVVDPENEYNHLCEQVHGQYVRISSEALQINPFELYGTSRTQPVEGENLKDQVNFFREKILNLITLLELLLSDNGALPQKEKAFLYRCLLKTYENRGITMDPTTHGRVPPSMQEFYVIMSSALRGDTRFGVGDDVYGLSERLERYLHLFPTRTKISLDNRFMDFNIRELNNTLKPIGLFLITEFLWTKMRQARQERDLQNNTIILIDEAWLLMQFQQGARFLEEFARRIRKYGGGLWCTTQNSDDFLSSDQGKTILAMATMKFLMKQDASTIDSVAQTFRLSRRQRGFLLGARRGEGLFSTKNWVQMEVVASPREAEMANTTLGSSLSRFQDNVAEQQGEFYDYDRVSMPDEMDEFLLDREEI
jgi:energy-coupling factor transporter ATP-binding protein EcfA2